MKFFQKYRDKKAGKIQERKSRLERSKKGAEVELDKMALKMLSSPCAINDMQACNPRCIHWQPGHVSYFYTYCDDPYGGFYYAVSPVCRLWGSK